MAKINDTTTFPNTAPALTDHFPATDVSDTSNDANGETVTVTFQAALDLFEANFQAPAGFIDAITEIDASLKSGADVTLVTGTAGTSGDLSIWNADGDLVDGPTPPSGTIVGTSDTQTLTNKTLTTPVIAQINDANGNEAATFAATASAVNYLNFINSATGNFLDIAAAGGDTNIGIDISPKGSGNVRLGNFVFDADATVGAGQDNYVLTYDDASGTIGLEAATGGGGSLSNVVEDTTPQLGGMLDVNGFTLGNGTLELLSFTEDASAVNHVNIENEATGGGPIISSTGDDTNVDLNIATKGSGAIKVQADVVPSADSTYDLGTTSVRYADAFADNIYATNGFILTEQADHPIAPSAGLGQIWVQNNATQTLYFTDDAGTDNEILTDGSGTTLTDTAAALTDKVPFFDASDSDNAKIDALGDMLKLKPECLIIAASDETTALTTGTAKATFRMPYAFTLTAVRASVTTAPTGSVLTVDINESGTTILSTKLTIDATEKTSTTAATAAVISDSALADDAEITIDIDGVGSTVAGAGLKVYLIGYQA